MKVKKRAFAISVASFLVLFTLACSVGGAATETFDPTMATLEAQLTQMSQQLTSAAQEGNLLAPGNVFIMDKSKTPTATTHWEIIGGVQVVVSLFSKTYVNVETGFCLDSNADGHAYTMPCNGGNFQKWSADGQTLVNAATDLCLDSNGNGEVYTLACNGGNFQKWTASGKTLVNVATGFCLDSNYDGELYTLACNGGNYQNWN